MPSRPATLSAPGHQSEREAHFDAQLAALAARQHLVFSLRQLEALGLTRFVVAARARRGRLHRVHHSVYSLVPPPTLTVKGRWLAATLACGPTAALSYRSAADLHGLRANQRRAVEVIVPGRATHRHAGVQVHRASHLDPARDLTARDGIRVTTVARTLLDLGAVLADRQLERALDQAEVLRVFDLGALVDQLRRNPRHPGAARLHDTLGGHTAGATLTESELEEQMLALTDAHGLPRAEANAPIDPGDGAPIIRPDFVWRAQKLAVEVDGVQYHLTRRAFETDRHRDQRLVAAGWRVIRITARQLRWEPERIARLLERLLQ